MTHTDRARAFFDHLGRELPLPAGEVEMLAGLLADVERFALAKAAELCRTRSETLYERSQENPDAEASAIPLFASIALDATAEAIEAMGTTGETNAVSPT